MNTLDNTISITKEFSTKTSEFSKELFQPKNADSPFCPKSKEEIYNELEFSRKQAAAGEVQDAKEFLDELRKEYGI